MVAMATTASFVSMTSMATSGQVSGVDNEKYYKRRRQTRDQRLKHALYLLGVSFAVLLYTWWTILSTPPEQSNNKGSVIVSPENLRYRPFDEKPKQPSINEIEEEEKYRAWSHDRKRNQNRIEHFKQMLTDLDRDVTHNENKGIRWAPRELLPPLHAGQEKPLTNFKGGKHNMGGRIDKEDKELKTFFKVKRTKPMAWENEDIDSTTIAGVDFTKHSYQYPEKLMELPETLGDYPLLRPLKDIMEAWPQEDIDSVPTPFQETLIHFDYTKPEDVEAARKFRDAKLPFKFINVPEIVAAGEKWTDDFVSTQFDDYDLDGHASESPDSFFPFFTAKNWNVEQLGIPPTRHNDWTYANWAEHARYADAVGLDPHAPHFYFQSGVPLEERYDPKEDWSFISRDLPSLSSPTETFFVFEPESQKGIQCRFGERGVTAATHYDGGRNMVAMITGAKRYILSPPNQCPKLGLVTTRSNPIFRHSLLNFGHLNYMDDEEMPADERAWLERSAEALSIDTVLKAGEVLYIPSHWFHYISSLQKSAQCNVRSGVDVEGDEVFGGEYEVTEGCVPE